MISSSKLNDARRATVARAGFLVVIALVAMTLPAAATPFTVTNTNDSGAGSLRQAITDSNTAGGTNTISFTVGGTVTLASELPIITSAVTINGKGNNPTVSGNNQFRVFFVDAPSGSAVNISNLTIANGQAKLCGPTGARLTCAARRFSVTASR